MNNKTEKMNEYLDWYEDLLTEKQKEICTQYYREDFSLAEISENFDVSRSAILDTLRRSEKIMEEYEEKLQLVQKFHARSDIYDKIKSFGNKEINQYVMLLEENE